MLDVRLGLFAALLSAFILLGCDAGGNSLYPLGEGESWIYQIDVTSGRKSHKATMKVTNMAQRELEGNTVTPQRVESDGATYFNFFTADPEGIRLVASQRSTSAQPSAYKTPMFYLKHPYVKGTEWDHSLNTALIRPGVELVLHVIVEGDEEVVTVPAGNFERCCRVAGRGQTEPVFVTFSTERISVEYVAWYCLGIGLVKYVLKEEASESNVEFSLQLVEWQRP